MDPPRWRQRWCLPDVICTRGQHVVNRGQSGEFRELTPLLWHTREPRTVCSSKDQWLFGTCVLCQIIDWGERELWQVREHQSARTGERVSKLSMSEAARVHHLLPIHTPWCIVFSPLHPPSFPPHPLHTTSFAHTLTVTVRSQSRQSSSSKNAEAQDNAATSWRLEPSDCLSWRL